MGFSIFFPWEFPLQSQVGKMTESERWWVNAQFLWRGRRWRRVIVMVARLGCSLENSSPDFPRDARVEWPGGTVSYPGPSLVQARTLLSFTADLDRLHSSTHLHLQSLTPPPPLYTTLHHSIQKQISYSGEIWWLWNLLLHITHILLVYTYDIMTGQWSGPLVISHK